MSNIYDKATVELFVNGEQAEAQLDKLRRSAEDLDTQLQAALAAGDNKQATKLQRELDKVNKAIGRTETLFKGTGIVLNDLSNATITGLKNSLKFLKAQLNATKPNTEKWHQYAEQIKAVKERLSELSEELKEEQSLWDRFKDWSVTVWPAFDLLEQWGGSFIDIARGAVDAFAEMDQEMANVRKFAGLSASEVEELNDQFKRMDTRTAREDLNKLAQEAGRLGKNSVEDVMGFVRAADKINVALDDLGEGATLTLSKLTGVFGDEARYGTEQSLLKVGSVINELSQNCSASAPYLAQFASRMGGVGAQARMTIPQIMAFGAVLDSNGQAVEASATALSQVIVRMMQDPAKYARVAGLDVQNFANMLKTDVNGALILFLETLQQAGGMDVLSPMFKDMGENGSRAIAALSTLASNIDAVKSQQIEANKAFAEGTSVTAEFNVQNTTVQASLEKAQKAVNDLRVELGENLAPVMSQVISSSSILIRILVNLLRFFWDHKTSIISVTAAIVAYNVVLNMAAIKTAALTAWTKLFNAALLVQRASLIAVSGVVALLSGNITRATAAFRLFSAAVKANPLGLAISLITMAGTAIYSWINKVKEARRAEMQLAREREKNAREFRNQISNISQTAGDYAKSELDRLDALYKATQDNTKSQKERIAAVKDLQRTYPTAFGNLSQEKILTGEAASAYDLLAQNIIKAAKAKAAAEKIKDNEKLLLDLEIEREDLEQSIKDNSEALDRAVSKRNALTRRVSSNNMLSLSGPSARDRRRLEESATTVQTLNDNLDASSDRLETIIMQTSELTAVNERLAKKAGDPSKIAPDVDFSNPIAVPPPAADVEDADGSKKTSAKDRFSAEKAWRERQEAEARISYAKGETLFSQHTQRMAEIERDYWQLILDRSDLSEKERLSALASYWEAVNKETTSQANVSKDITEANVKSENAEYEAQLAILRRHHLRRLADESLSAEEREAENARYNEAVELEELMHLKKIRDLYAEGSAERLTAQRNFENKELAARERHLKEMEEREAQFAKIKNDVFGLNQSEKDAEYARQHEALTQVLSRELQAVGDNEAEKLRIKEAFLAAEAELRRKYNQEGAEETSSAYSSAIAKSVEWLRGDGGQALSGALSTVTSGMSSIFSELSSMVQAELDVQTATIESRYNREVQLAQGNSYKIAKLEKKKNAEIAKAKNDANKKMFAMQVIQAVAQTATNALNAYGSAAAIPVVGHIMAPIAAAMAVAAGAVQIAAIKKQQQASQAQGYSKGGFTKPGAVDEPAGIVHAGEWVASQRLLASPVARPMIEALDYAQRTNTIGSLRADDVSRSITAPDSLVRIAEGDGGSSVVVAAALAQSARAVAALSRRLDEPFVTVNTVSGDKGIKAAQDEYSRLMANKSPKTRRNATAR
ncbi:MAG: phage tail tape measure protein [Duncaniella sp.]|nr:phage tail tape measure protein [Duncaniella sp.]